MAPRDIESLLPQLLSFPPHPPPPLPLADAAYDKEIKSLRRLLNELPANLLTAGVPNGGDLLDVRWTPAPSFTLTCSGAIDIGSVHQHSPVPLRPARSH